ncbi:Nucleotide-binding, alpha-beta plait, partial [Cynara cardunculus var. scolymus]
SSSNLRFHFPPKPYFNSIPFIQSPNGFLQAVVSISSHKIQVHLLLLTIQSLSRLHTFSDIGSLRRDLTEITDLVLIDRNAIDLRPSSVRLHIILPMAALDMTLDDMIKSRRNTDRGRGRGRGRARGGRGQGRSFGGGRPIGPPRRGPLALNARPSAYTIAKASSNLWISYAFDREFRTKIAIPISDHFYLLVAALFFWFSKEGVYDGFYCHMLDISLARFSVTLLVYGSFRRPKNSAWQRDLFEESLKAAGLPGFDNGAKLHVSNLDIGVTNEDIRELFSEIGELKRYAIHYDKNGRPSGSAEVLFARRSDAFQALKRYNNVQLDGRPMKIEIEGSNPEIPLSARVNVVGGLNGQRTVVMTSGVGRGRGAPAATATNRAFVQRNRGGIRNARGGMTNMRGGIGRGRGGRGRGRGQSGGRGRGRGRKQAVDKSADELDKELESYHAMQT